MPPKSPNKNPVRRSAQKFPEKLVVARKKIWNDDKTTQLISFVEKNEALWVIDKKCYLSGKDIHTDLWNEIGNELKCTGKQH